jgi:hypothetical protein
VCLKVDEIVHLQEVDLAHLQLRQRLLHLRDARKLTTRPDLGRNEQPVLDVKRVGERADHFLGASIHRRAVHELAAQLDEPAQQGRPRVVLSRANVERLPRAKSYDRNRLAGARNRSPEQSAHRNQRTTTRFIVRSLTSLDPESGCIDVVIEHDGYKGHDGHEGN